MTLAKNRDKQIDLAKGVGIYLVVLGHSMVPRPEFIYAFHMPLFFVISGILYKNKRSSTFIKNKFKHLLLPFLIAFGASWMLQFGVYQFLGLGSEKITEPMYLASSLVLGDSDSVNNSPLWFLTCLFSLTIIYHFIQQLFVGWGRHLMILLFSFAGVFFALNDILLPLKIQVAFTALLFFHLGHHGKKILSSIQNQRRWLLAIPVLLVIHYYGNLLNIELSEIKKVNMYANTIGYAPLFYLTGLTGTLWFLILVYNIKPNKVLTYLGRNSLYILVLHYPIINIFRVLLQKFFDIRELGYSIVVSILVTAICAAVIKVSTTFSKKIIP